MISFRLAGFGTYRPREHRPSTAFDTLFGKPAGWTETEFGIAARGVAAPDETSSMMAASACEAALAEAGWPASSIDLLIGACGVMEQPIPGTSVLIQERLGLGRSGIPAFDVNQTCLSFLTALDIAALGIAQGRWRRVLIASSDIASAGLDLGVPASAAIFGDGAAAVCVEADGGSAGLLASRFATWGEGHDLAVLAAGGTRVRVAEGYDALIAGSRFRMDAFGIFRAAARGLPKLVDATLAEAGLTRQTVDLIVCHQASAPGVEHVRRLMGGAPARVVDIFADHGNQIAASLPSGLVAARRAGLLRPGMSVLLLGTAAGISAAAMALRL
ncbi:3-oxoacyl-[acyl-carrier-protein] synthase III C-terminal domain-containing protein [Sphingomonas sanxanigenens]|uniref:3-oxoacyl-ACP synthase n=1 Tax=Sphingomonas sanxanigenens DSM 19645 = NX02 TaxID=1123269 RepID=W0AGQ4_9SPHN|nr:3-oxoacyl-[acyl-carrier-protein] synthase III C-terminal domain-containing protein [Sphingomonas sanxanigenens]AHE56306.1 hypothetical protein NX02_23455 [Sphingomonas sanxanigenens DSM 19645 = NX02]